MADENVQEPKSRVSRRQLIKGGMVAGGVALWSAPMVAAARFGRFDRVRTISPFGASVAAPGPAQATAAPTASADGETVLQLHGGCEGYPPGQCFTFECGGSVHECGDGVTILGKTFRCFCDITTEGSCFCGNDSPCALLSSCNSTADCPPGYACIDSSCCGGNKCVAPCGTFPALPTAVGPDVQANSVPANDLRSLIPNIEKILAGGRTSGLSR